MLYLVISMEQETIFTKIIKGDIPSYKIYEDDKVLAFLDIHPIQPGHVLVISKAQVDPVWDLPDQDYDAVMWAAKRIAVHLKNKLGVDRVGCQIIGVDVHHAHVHLIPFNTVEEFRASQNMSTEPDHAALEAMRKKLTLEKQ